MHRVVVDGRHLALGGEPFRVHGVTYGSFVPRLDGALFPEHLRVKQDLTAMAELGLNTVRTYSVPPADVLDLADELGLRVIIGLDYHDWRMEPTPGRAAHRRILDAGRRAVDLALERSEDRPCVLAIAVGNEVPADVVRVHGIARVQRVLEQLIASVQAAGPALLATYVSFPTTEFLEVGGQDLVCFNVFLEDPAALRRYLVHLQVVAADRPVLVTELGLASEAHGRAAQAASLRDQLQVVDEAGCAGATVFSWTDEWGVNGQPVEGWGFGITDTARVPKPAVQVVADWTRTGIAARRDQWPRVSVVVCAYNESRTIEECLTSLARCRYPNLEVIVCDDGSADGTLDLAKRFPFRVIALEHGGLSRARNAGLAAATGSIVAYLDADAACHPEWPFHLALSLEPDGVVATGGPNLAFDGVGVVERAVALSPGGPAEVLTADDRAEHVPGCNMAYERAALVSIDGFNAAYTSAGDDVDVCWKLLDRGGEIGFAAAAQVHHHRRTTVKAYLRQQRGYGRAERMLAGAHPHRFNRLGQARWGGSIYGSVGILPTFFRPVVYHGYMGGAPFQGVTRRRSQHVGMWLSALLPFTAPVALAGAVIGIFWPWAMLVPAAMLVLVTAYAATVAAGVQPARGEPTPARLRALVAFMHVAQPFARGWGRLRGHPLDVGRSAPEEWSGDRWMWLRAIEDGLRVHGCAVRAGGPSDPFDLAAAAGPTVSARITTAVMWKWEPQVAVAYRPRASLWVGAVASVVVGLALSWIGWLLLACVITAAAFELAILRRRVFAALRSSTRGVDGMR